MNMRPSVVEGLGAESMEWEVQWLGTRMVDELCAVWGLELKGNDTQYINHRLRIQKW